MDSGIMSDGGDIFGTSGVLTLSHQYTILNFINGTVFGGNGNQLWKNTVKKHFNK